jgi:hypothetical protein
MKHKGELVIDKEMINKNNLPYIICFADKNTAIKSLSLNEALLFSRTKKQSSVKANAELVGLIIDLICCFKGENL